VAADPEENRENQGGDQKNCESVECKAHLVLLLRGWCILSDAPDSNYSACLYKFESGI
jgi:hypothetical protein